MLEIIQYIFSDFWTWAGFNISALIIFVCPICCIADCISEIAIKKHEIDKSYEQLERDRCRNEHNQTEL